MPITNRRFCTTSWLSVNTRYVSVTTGSHSPIYSFVSEASRIVYADETEALGIKAILPVPGNFGS